MNNVETDSTKYLQLDKLRQTFERNIGEFKHELDELNWLLRIGIRDEAAEPQKLDSQATTTLTKQHPQQIPLIETSFFYITEVISAIHLLSALG